MNSRLLVALVAANTFANPASAHAFLKRAHPSAGAALAGAPKSVTLAFTEKLEPAFSGVTVTDSAGHNVAAGAAIVDGVSIVVPLRPLSRGAYRVSWRAVSCDKHRTEGSYNFTVSR